MSLISSNLRGREPNPRTKTEKASFDSTFDSRQCSSARHGCDEVSSWRVAHISAEFGKYVAEKPRVPHFSRFLREVGLLMWIRHRLSFNAQFRISQYLGA